MTISRCRQCRVRHIPLLGGGGDCRASAMGRARRHTLANANRKRDNNRRDKRAWTHLWKDVDRGGVAANAMAPLGPAVIRPAGMGDFPGTTSFLAAGERAYRSAVTVIRRKKWSAIVAAPEYERSLQRVSEAVRRLSGSPARKRKQTGSRGYFKGVSSMLWILAVHVSAMLSWCAALLYLPVLIVGINARRAGIME